MRQRAIPSVFIILTVSFGLRSAVHAQAVGGLQGLVLDKLAKPVVGAVVIATRPGNGLSRGVVTDPRTLPGIESLAAVGGR